MVRQAYHEQKTVALFHFVECIYQIMHKMTLHLIGYIDIKSYALITPKIITQINHKDDL